MEPQKRYSIDCRLYPSSSRNCTLMISGTEDEVLETAIYHATTVHGQTNNPDLREQIRKLLREERTAHAA